MTPLPDPLPSSPLGKREKSLWTLAALLVLLALASGLALPLSEPAEGRYASLAASMERSGDYLVPRLNGVRHFEKPPLSIWIMAMTLELLGEHTWALRLASLLAASLILLAAFLLGGGRRSRAGPWAALLVAASPLFFSLSRAVGTDIYLAACCGLTLLAAERFLVHPAGSRAGRAWMDLAALLSGIGFFVKGPVVWLHTLVPLLAACAWSQDRPRIRAIVSFRRAAIFVAAACPWFVAIGLRRPETLAWMVRERTIGALLSSKGFHDGAWYYYVPVVLFGIYPAVMVLLGAGSRALRHRLESQPDRLMALAAVIPFVVFSLSASKLATYLLPAVLPLAVLAAKLLAEGWARRGLMTASGSMTLLLPAGAIVLHLRGKLGLVDPRWLAVTISAWVLSSIIVFELARRDHPQAAGGALAGLLIALLVAILPAATRGASVENVGVVARRLVADGRPLIFYRVLVQSFPFLTGRDARTFEVYEPGRLAPDEAARIPLRSVQELRELLSAGPVAVVCQPRQLARLIEQAGPLTVVTRTPKLVLLTNTPGSFSAAHSPRRHRPR